MLTRVGLALTGCAALLVAGAGCNRGGSEAPPGAEADHAHRAGEHGGTVVAIGRGHYHVEAVFPEGGIELFVLGPDETRVQEVPAQTLAAYVKAADRMQADPITLEPKPQPGDSVGSTSRFAGKLPDQCAGREVLVTVPRLTIGGERFRFSVTRTATPHAAMPAKVLDTEEKRLYLMPGGTYTAADIAANGNRTASEAFKGFSATHDHKPKPGDKLCPVTLTKANPACSWVVGGQRYEFCCPPCVDEFVQLAKEKPDQIKPPSEYVKK